MTTPESCQDEHRRFQVLHHPRHPFNGIDYIEVGAEGESGDRVRSGRGDPRLLTLHFLRHAPEHLSAANVQIEGGRRITGITALKLWPPQGGAGREAPESELTVQVDREGDFSPYTLRLVETTPDGRPTDTPLRDFDPRYAQITFSFKVDCPTDLDCAETTTCAAGDARRAGN